jgi:hypothetical protein
MTSCHSGLPWSGIAFMGRRRVAEYSCFLCNIDRGRMSSQHREDDPAYEEMCAAAAASLDPGATPSQQQQQQQPARGNAADGKNKLKRTRVKALTKPGAGGVRPIQVEDSPPTRVKQARL